MERFLVELKKLLEDHDATIVRSASKESELVVCISKIENNMIKNIEATFDEEIGSTAIKNKWFQIETRNI